MGFLFKSGGSQDIRFLVLQKRGKCLPGLLGYLSTWNGIKKILFLRFLEINLQTFAKYYPIFENKGLFYAKFYGALCDHLFSS